VNVTVASTTGAWWFEAESSKSSRNERRCKGCRGDQLCKSIMRSTILSFGSICFGSLVVGPAQILYQAAEYIRPNREGSAHTCFHEFFSCFQECIISCVDGLAYTCNAWSFTFIGLYGYGFVDAGHNAIDLFRKRGWTSIVTDDLIPTVLLMVSLVIGGVTGGFAMLIENIQGFGLFPSFGQPQLSAFL
jgi:hypothetical protein